MNLCISKLKLSWEVEGQVLDIELNVEQDMPMNADILSACAAKEVEVFGEVKSANLLKQLIEAIISYDLNFDGG